MRKILLFICLSLPILSAAQFQPSHDIFPNFGNYERKGWLINPSLTYTLKPIKSNQLRLFTGSDTVYDVMFDTKGKLGVGLEIGRFYAIDNSRIISYVDFSLGIKILRGAEKFEAVLDDPDRLDPYIVSGEGVFSQNYATASFNATNARPISRKVSLHNTLGLNADYRLTDYYEYYDRGLPITLNEPERFVFQAHYKLGVGVWVRNNLMVIPSVETPLVTFYEYDDLKSSLSIFNSRYRPLIFRLTVLLMDNKPDRKCPPKKKRSKSESLFGSLDSKRPW